MLIREKQHLLASLEGPVEYFLRIGGGADDAAMFTAERFQIRRGVDIGNRGNAFVRIEHAIQFLPGSLNLLQVGHVGHCTAGRQIWQDGYLFGTRNDIGDLGHEVYAAKDDVLGAGIGRLARQL